MARNLETSSTAPTPARFTDAFVIFSVTVVSLALGAWLLLRLGLSLWAGLVLALAIYTVLLSLHLILRQSWAPGQKPAARSADLETWPAPEAEAADPPVRGPSLADALGELTAPRRTATAEPSLPRPRAGDPFNFRPTQPPGLSTPDAVLAARDEQPPEMSVELIQDLIKKLADELNGGPPAAAGDGPAGRPAPANETEALIGRSIAALETTAKTMRAPVAERAPPPPPREPAQAPSGWWPAEPQAPPPAPAPPPQHRQAPPPLNPELARIAEAVAAERIQMLLEPIHALAEGRPRHFEVSMRLLTADGAVLEQADLARLAQGSGLMARIDTARIVRAARIARKLAERGRSGSVLATIAGESLTDTHFVGTASAEPGGGQTRLVLSFTQDEVRAFSRGHMETLTSLAQAGFGFALDGVTDLDMDFGALRKLGFEFVKLDAPVFLEGLPAPSGHVPAADICRSLADYGLTLVVGKIEDDWLLARILGFGVLFGRGTLFGGPKLVKAEIVAASAAA